MLTMDQELVHRPNKVDRHVRISSHTYTMFKLLECIQVQLEAWQESSLFRYTALGHAQLQSTHSKVENHCYMATPSQYDMGRNCSIRSG